MSRHTKPRAWRPSRKAIREACRAIQHTWSSRERRKRERWTRQRWAVPFIPDYCDCEELDD